MRTKKSARTSPKCYSVGLIEENNTFRLVDSFELKQINQHKSEWERTKSRDLARKLNRSKLVIK